MLNRQSTSIFLSKKRHSPTFMTIPPIILVFFSFENLNRTVELKALGNVAKQACEPTPMQAHTTS